MKTKKTILLVEDHLPQLNRTKALLENAEYSVVAAINGIEAIDYLNSNNPLPDLILSDLNMPEMNGLELCEKAQKSFKDIPLIIITTDDDKKNLQKAFDTGAMDFLGKPFSKIRIHKSVQEVGGQCTWFRKASCVRFHVPSSFHRRK